MQLFERAIQQNHPRAILMAGMGMEWHSFWCNRKGMWYGQTKRDAMSEPMKLAFNKLGASMNKRDSNKMQKKTIKLVL
jgi:hypothetical protein